MFSPKSTKKPKVSKKLHPHQLKAHSHAHMEEGKGGLPHTRFIKDGEALFSSGGALMPAGYGEGKARGGKRGRGITGKQILDGIIKYGPTVASTAAMFL